MRKFKFILLAIGIAPLLMGCTVYSTESYVYDSEYRRPHRPYIAEPIFYDHPVMMRPRYEPIYERAQGVARPERFVCGVDVFTGNHNCVKRSKAHFVRPIGYTPAPRRHYGW